MTQITGMDTAEVRRIGEQMKAAGSHLHETMIAIDKLVGSAGTVWQGKDAHDFAGWWTSQHRPAMEAASSRVTGLGQSALNNATEQEHASGIASGSVSTGPVVHTAPGGATPVAATSANAHAASTAAFTAAWDGKYLDYDKRYGNQCYDVFSQYNHDVVGGPDIQAVTTGGAKDIYNDYATNGAAAHYDRIPAGTGHPQVGDVVVWGNGTYGHVGVVTSVTGDGFTALEQNTDAKASDTTTGALTHQVDHSYSASGGVLGYLRPKDAAV